MYWYKEKFCLGHLWEFKGWTLFIELNWFTEIVGSSLSCFLSTKWQFSKSITWKGGWEGGGEKRPTAELRDLINQPYMLLLLMGISSCVNHSNNHLSSPFPACVQFPPALWIFFWVGGGIMGQLYTGYPTLLLSLISLCNLLSPSALTWLLFHSYFPFLASLLRNGKWLLQWLIWWIIFLNLFSNALKYGLN